MLLFNLARSHLGTGVQIDYSLGRQCDNEQVFYLVFRRLTGGDGETTTSTGQTLLYRQSQGYTCLRGTLGIGIQVIRMAINGTLTDHGGLYDHRKRITGRSFVSEYEPSISIGEKPSSYYLKYLNKYKSCRSKAL